MELSHKTKIEDLLKEYPFLMEYFINRSPKFKLLQSTVMRRTVGRVATMTQAASIGGIDADQLLAEIAAEIKTRTGKEVSVVRGEGEE
jgi:hypothetical protein